MKILNLSNKIIEFSYYALFFLIPLIFWKDTSELYELNKMWLTFSITTLIAAAWMTKTIILKRFYLQRTPLDIPIAVFLTSQVISTIFSLDPYVSLWGYYSRFNGGLLSIISYIFLYYAFVSNFSLSRGGEVEGFPTARSELLRRVAERLLSGGRTETGPHAIDMVKRLLMISLVSATIVALWGLPSHFGYDPTCLIFRGSFDVSCWTADFQPKIRIFSTLGQPAWLGAYLSILSPLFIALYLNSKRKLFIIGYLLLAGLFYLDILFTKSRAALLGFWVSTALFGAHYFLKERELKIENINLRKAWSKIRPFSLLLILFLILTAVVLNPVELNKGKVQLQKSASDTKTGSFSSGGGGTESGKIRLYVWQGALNAWIHNPIIGTGVETFAFAYYKYKPAIHNLTSEWNYLYNKAHNEYLNYLATTGIFGLGSYLFIVGSFLNSIWKLLNRKTDLLILTLVAGYISILITNFFGFSVVIVNIYFFLIPAMVFILAGLVNPQHQFVFSWNKLKFKDVSSIKYQVSVVQWVYIGSIILTTFYLLLFLVRFWLADISYALGQNLAKAGEYTSSYFALKEAVDRASFEPTYKDELSSNDAIFSVALLSQLPKDEKNKQKVLTFAQDLAKEAVDLVNQITSEHPNNVVFLKTKVRVYYILSQIDPKYNKDALDAIVKAQKLAPTDANIYYNLGLLYDQTGDTRKAVEIMKDAIKIKPNYINAYYALGLFYRKLAVDKKGNIIDYDLNKKAIEQMDYILKSLDPNNKDAKDALSAFEKNQ